MTITATPKRGAVPIAVFISGQGSNLAAILRYQSYESCGYRVSVVVCDQPLAKGIAIAQQSGIATIVEEKTTTRRDHERIILSQLRSYDPYVLVLAGYMRILSQDFIRHYPQRILNIHPSLLPQYPGLNTHERVINNHEKHHGCSVHIVTPQVDDGEIIAQRSLRVLPTDNPVSVAKRVLELEHQVYPLAIDHYVRKF